MTYMQEDPFNAIMAGALTGGFLQLRSGLRPALRSAMFGGMLLVSHLSEEDETGTHNHEYQAFYNSAGHPVCVSGCSSAAGDCPTPASPAAGLQFQQASLQG